MAAHDEADLWVVDLGGRGLRLGEKRRGLLVIRCLQHERRVREKQTDPCVVIAGVERELSAFGERRGGFRVLGRAVVGGTDKADAGGDSKRCGFTRVADRGAEPPDGTPMRGRRLGRRHLCLLRGARVPPRRRERLAGGFPMMR